MKKVEGEMTVGNVLGVIAMLYASGIGFAYLLWVIVKIAAWIGAPGA